MHGGDEMAEEEKVFCLSCGQTILKDARFCSHCGAPVQSTETVAPSSQGATRLCLTCGRSYPSEYSFCPHCGSYPAGGAPSQQTNYQSYPIYQKEPLGPIKYVAWLLAFLVPIIGVIWGIIWMLDKDQEKKDAGKIALIIGIVAWLLNFICLLYIGF